jgi:hypothetical protein
LRNSTGSKNTLPTRNIVVVAVVVVVDVAIVQVDVVVVAATVGLRRPVVVAVEARAYNTTPSHLPTLCFSVYPLAKFTPA